MQIAIDQLWKHGALSRLQVLLVIIFSGGDASVAESLKPVYGTNKYAEHHPGLLPLILSVPHGGSLKPESIPDRSYGGMQADSYTKELAEEISDGLSQLTGSRPHSVIMNLHRSKCDANRDVTEAAQGNAAAIQAWKEFHGFLSQAGSSVLKRFKYGLLVDVHGQSRVDRIELGYVLTANDLEKNSLDQFRQQSSISRLSFLNADTSFTQLVRGTSSLGSLLSSSAYGGYKVVPSAAEPSPDEGSYYSGGFITKENGVHANGNVVALDAVQIEMPRPLRFDVATRKKAAANLARALLQVLQSWYRFGVDGDNATSIEMTTTTTTTVVTTKVVTSTTTFITTTGSTTTTATKTNETTTSSVNRANRSGFQIVGAAGHHGVNFLLCLMVMVGITST